MSFTITNGPFKGTVAPANELQTVRSGSEQDPDFRQNWGVHHRTRVFLEVFPPTEGWRVVVETKNPGIDMRDIYTLDINNSPVVQPTREFIATLLDPNQAIVASCSVLKIINSENAWKAGISAARAGLYEALGLPANLQEEGPDSQNPQRQSKGDQIKEIDVAGNLVTPAEPIPQDEPLVVIPIDADESPLERGIAIHQAVEKTLESSDTSVDETPGSDLTAAPTTASEPTDDEGHQDTDDASVASDALDVTVSSPAETTVSETQAASTPAPRRRAPKTKAPQNGSPGALGMQGGEVPRSIKKQIEILSKKAGKPIPEYQGLEEAKSVLHSLVCPNVGPAMQESML